VIVPGRRTSPAILVIASALVLLSALCIASLALRLFGFAGHGSGLGRFLLERFSWAGFFVPLYLAAGVVLLLRPTFRRRSALLLMFSIVPFLTLSLILNVLAKSTGYLPQLLLDTFGMIPSALLLFLLLALEAIVILTLPRGTRSTAVHEAPRPPLALPASNSPTPVIEAIIADGPPEPVPLRPQPSPREERVRLEPPPAVEDQPAPASPPEDDAAAEDPPPASAARPRPKAPAVIITPGPEQEELPFPKTGSGARPYGIPVHHVLKNRGDNEYWVIDDETKRASRILTDALKEFNIDAEVTGIRKGPVITLFEVLPAQGVRVSKIANLSDNIALRLAAPSVRIVAPIPGRHAVGIEVPNKVRSIVSFKEMISLDVMQKSPYEIPVALGKDILGEAQVIDLIQTPHLLIGGATNSGKSVLVNSIICSILFRRSPDEVRLFLIDPKIVELKLYNGCPHLLTPVITDPKKAFQALQYCISEMERRYTLLDALGVRDIRSFNKKAKKERVQRLPYIVIVVDEFADLMATTGKELESTLARLAAMARAIGIHMVLATQRPSIDVITGLIKANIPSRIAFMVANKFDSRIIIDAVGAEKLLGKGDMLFSAAWNPFPTRIQGAYIDDEETDAVTEYVKKLGPPQYIEDEVFFDEEDSNDFEGEPGNDPLYERAMEIVMGQGKASASYLQRRLKVGYNRAARLVEEMEMRGIVGPAQGSKPREILHMPSKSGG
jgi:S-DNA-T family DNA segregation ATPase FtsK/SpoIIIE